MSTPGWTCTHRSHREKEKLTVVTDLKRKLSDEPTALALGWLWTTCSQSGCPHNCSLRYRPHLPVGEWYSDLLPHVSFLGITEGGRVFWDPVGRLFSKCMLIK